MAQDNNNNERFDFRAFIAKHGGGTVAQYSGRQFVYRQGDPAVALYYIVSGTVKVTFNSEGGKEAVIAILGAGDFFGEGCVIGQLSRRTTITTTSACEIARFDQAMIKRALSDDPAFSSIFLNFLLKQNEKLKTDLIDQLFSSSERRLARILLTLAKIGQAEQSSVIALPINQELLANMVGTTRSRINQFMNKFRKLGYVEYNDHIKVHGSLLNLLLYDQSQDDQE
jgi:CRP/FNR family transcriptional regulator, cyclic AMP receptor protein